MNLEQFINKKYLSKGQTGVCYLLDNNTVLKIFNDSMDVSKIDKFKYLQKFNNDSFVFPFEFVQYNNVFLGYLSEFVVGKKLRDVFYDSDLTTMSKKSYKLEKDIDFLSTGKIIIEDFSADNVIYNDEFKVIDPDCYTIVNSYEIADIKKLNHKIHRGTILNLFVLPYLKKREKHKFIIDKADYYRDKDIKVSELILSFKDDLEKYCKEEIHTMDEFSKILRR